MIWTIGALITCVKLLLLPAYRSTDFEVHRNWLAITSSLPINKWYFEETSEWTLDYPPLFAWFEFVLSQFARFFDSEMLRVDNLNYASDNTILFQRLSVIITDFIYFYGVYECSKLFPKGKRSEITLTILLIANPGLLMVDHVHFQYNGIMYGILLLSIANIMQEKFLAGAYWFTVLLNMKHIYIYVAPAYFVYLLRNYCFTSKSLKTVEIFKSISFTNVGRLGTAVLVVFIVSFAPFYDHIGQVLSRLFPFKRGLCHAYWAPNFWALYNIVDKVSVVLVSKMGVDVTITKASMTGGLVQEFSHAVLPTVTPLCTMVLTLLSVLPAMLKLWKSGLNARNFARCIVICALSSFMFGWHVHEKAILMAIIPLSIVAVMETGDAKVFLLLSTVGHYSLFPLLHPGSLLFVKLLLLLIHSSYAFYSLYNLNPFQFCKITLPLLNTIESIYLLGLAPLFVYTEILHGLLYFKHLPFLPLMLTSVYCSFGVTYCWIKYYLYYLVKCK